MAVQRRALIRKATGIVENVILSDDDFQAPAGCELIASDVAGPGDTWDGKVFKAPLRPTEAPVIPSADPRLRDEWLAANTVAKKLQVIARALGLEA